MPIEVVATTAQLMRLVVAVPGAKETSLLEFKQTGYKMGKGVPNKEKAEEGDRFSLRLLG